jgi:regulator of sirC expression with transglutaminase-like and TPR domain
MVSYLSVRELTELLAGRSQTGRLDVAALELARIEFPGLAIDPYLAILDSLAAGVPAVVASTRAGQDFVAGLNDYLFGELGFGGNEADYHSPRNSCLNAVLASRTGIPITLSVIYLEVCRRLRRPAWGIGLPGHFLVRYDDGHFGAYIDPFHRGRLLTAAECLELARQVTENDSTDTAAGALAPATERQILIRMLNNLRAIYGRNNDHAKLVDVLGLLLVAQPDSPGEYRQRGIAYIELSHYRAAARDLQRYLQLHPTAADRQGVVEQIRRLRRFVASMN